MSSRILVVDDDPDIVMVLCDRLQAVGHEVMTASNGQQALTILEGETPGLLLLDIELPKVSGLEVLKRVRHSWPELPVVVMTAHGTIARAVEAMKAGAVDFITKPFDFEYLKIAVDKVLEREVLRREVTALRSEVESRYTIVIGNSEKMKAQMDVAKKVSQSDTTVLLLGESGTGKELFARSIHAWSARRDRLFMPINCVALSGELLQSELFGHEKGAFTGAHARKPGKLEVADGGTVFLDEIGDMEPGLQVKLLRVLQEREFDRLGGTHPIKVNIRVIAATNRDLRHMVKTGAFREDLFFRLNVVTLTLPPLRDRPEDIQPLAEFFLQKYCHETKRPLLRFSAEAVKALSEYPWRGNIRELENVIERLVVLKTGDEVVEPEELALQSWESWSSDTDDSELLEGPFHEAVEQLKQKLIRRAMARAGGNQTRAAELLGLQRSYLARLMKQRGIQ